MNLQGVDLILLDVDGTCVRTKSGEKFRKTADDWEWIPGRLEALHYLIAKGHTKIALVTNQGGVGFGFFMATQIGREIARLIEDLNLVGGLYYVCFSHPSATIASYRLENDFRRKPNPGMLLQAMLDYQVGPRNTLMIGDMEDDKGAAIAAACHFDWADTFFAGVQYWMGKNTPAIGTLADIIREHHPESVAQQSTTEDHAEDAAWDALVSTSESQVFLNQLDTEARAANETGTATDLDTLLAEADAQSAHGEVYDLNDVLDATPEHPPVALVDQVVAVIQANERDGQDTSLTEIMDKFNLPTADEAATVLAEAVDRLLRLEEEE